MEQEPFSLLSPEDDKDKKDKRKKRDKFAVPVPVSENEKSKNEKSEKPEPTALDKAVAELALKKREEAAKRAAEEAADERAKKPAAEEAEKAKKPEKPAPEPETTEVRAVKTETEEVTDDSDKEEAAESEERVQAYELPPTDLGGGEVIIHLQGDKTREERVIPLHAEAEKTDEEPPEPAAEEPAESSEASAVEAAAESTAEAPEAATGGGGEVPPTEPPETGLPTGDAPEPPERPNFFHSSEVPPAAGVRADTPSTAESPETPPVSAAADFSMPPEAIRSAEFASPAADGPAESSRSERSNARYATKSELEDTVYTATREGQNRGVLAGLIAGGGYEHFKHKRREKRQAKRMKEQARKLDKLQEQQAWQGRQHEREVERLKRTAHEAEVSREPAQALLIEQPAQQIEQHRFSEGMPFPLPTPAGRFGEQPMERPTAWQNRPIEQMHVHGAESSSGTSEAPLERDRAKREQEEKVRLAHVPAPAEQLEIPPEHRLQSSAWHSIEVDSRTGKPVENPVFEYGHEYYRERSQESGPRGDVHTAAGEAALVAEALSSTTDAPGGRDSANQPMLPPSATTHVTPQTYVREKTKKASGSLPSAGPLWPYVVAFVVVVILLIAVLR
jgi:hypothetical protein